MTTVASLSWGGYANGKIPLSALTKVSNFRPLAGEPVGAGGALLMTEAARQWEIMCHDAEAATKESPTASECYRDYPSQQGRYATYQRNKRPLAAYPGTSNHGWGRSVDIGTNARTWITKNGSKYGFYATVAGEPWHFDYLGNPTITTAQSSAAPLEEEEMTTRLYRNMATNTIAAIDPTTGYYWALPGPAYIALLAKMKVVPSGTAIELPVNEWDFIVGRVTEHRQLLAEEAARKVPTAVWEIMLDGFNGKQSARARLAGADLKADSLNAAAIASLVDAIKKAIPASGGISQEALVAAIKAADLKVQLDTKALVKEILDEQSERLKD